MVNLAFKFMLEISKPTGMWEKIIMAFNSGIKNYAWAVIIFTIVLKLVLSPLDFLNRYISVKNTKVQAQVQPEIEKLKKQCGNNKQMLNQKTMEVYKKYNYNVTGSCIIMLVNLVLTLVIFITLFGGLNSMASYKNKYQYNEIQKSYYSVEDYSIENLKDKYKEYYEEYYTLNSADASYTKEANENFAKTKTVEYINSFNSETNNANANAKYNEVKDSWLWIANVWKPDTPWKNSVASFDEYVASAGVLFADTKLIVGEQEITLSVTTLKDIAEVEYNQIMTPIKDANGRANGFLIVVILAAGVNALSILATQGKLKFRKNKQADEQPKQPGGLLMAVLIPGLMVYITMTYNAVFGLYVFVSSLVGLALTPLVNYLIKLIEIKKQEKKDKQISVSYSRKK
ncbi:MAG: YidC/Oxa1 family membrane protein insertase [Clostridia bacterium]|nr:YidC/Oxa1 family membrane protein insertase [Clostridia bacterium]